MTALTANSVLTYAYDSTGVGYDFVAGAVGLLVAGELAATNADAATATGTGVALDATVTTSTAPEVQPTQTGAVRPQPRLAGGRTVTLTAHAHLGTVTAHAVTRLELADEELIELL